ncbi:MAG TPA: acyltransferase family protein, partial [Micromonosporaceae bacterium]|nr:acyltransferase family protein [Micromonosporaceae bacterium]
LCALYAEILGVDGVTPDSSFVSLGGDSLSYVEMAVRLEQVVGRLPADWHARPIRDLRPPDTPTAGRDGARRSLETGVALRAVAILLVVGTHGGLFNVSGGAHLLLGLAGYNFARFHLTDVARRDRIRHVWASVGRILVPTLAWITAVMLLLDDYGVINIALLHGILGPREGGDGWHFWFIETLVYLFVGAALLLMIPAVDRLERRAPYAVPMAAVAAGLITRYDVFDLLPRYHLPSAARVFWIFALGWAAAKATTRWRRLLVTGAILLTIPGYFDRPQREAVIMAGLVLLVWVPSLPSLGWVNRAAGVLAAGSLYIYLTHWQVYPLLDHHDELLATAASLAVGLAYAAVAGWVTGRLRRLRRRT